MDLINWKKKGVVLDTGREGDWDFGSVAGPFVFDDKGRYLMFYIGFPVVGYEAGLHSIGVAESTDLLHWEKWPEPVFIPHEGVWWERLGIYKPFVMYYEDKYYLFYNARDKGYKEAWREYIV